MSLEQQRRGVVLMKLQGQVTCGACGLIMFRPAGCNRLTCMCGQFSCGGGCGLTSPRKQDIYDHLHRCRFDESETPTCGQNQDGGDPTCSHCPFHGRTTKCSNCHTETGIWGTPTHGALTCSETMLGAHLICGRCLGMPDEVQGVIDGVFHDVPCPIEHCDNHILAEDLRVFAATCNTEDKDDPVLLVVDP